MRRPLNKTDPVISSEAHRSDSAGGRSREISSIQLASLNKEISLFQLNNPIQNPPAPTTKTNLPIFLDLT